MTIHVKNNDVMKAYKILMKQLELDFKFLKQKREFTPKPKLRKLKSKQATIWRAKEQRKRDKIFEKEEFRVIIDSKKRAKQYKASQTGKQSTSKS